MFSSAGNGAKGVATGCTDVTGNTAGVVESTTEGSVVSRTAVLILDSCSKSRREAKDIYHEETVLKVTALREIIGDRQSGGNGRAHAT